MNLKKYRKYIVYSPAIGLAAGAVLGLLFGLIAHKIVSTEMLYGGAIGACAGYGFRNDYEKRHKDDEKK